MPLIHPVDGAAYVCRLKGLFWRFCGESTGVKRFDWLSLSCFVPPFDKFYQVQDAVDRW